MSRSIIAGAVLLISCGIFGVADAEDQRAPALALICATCHTHSGQTRSIPDIHGLSRAELQDKLRGFRDTRGDSTIMHRIVHAYSDDEIRLIAAYLTGAHR